MIVNVSATHTAIVTSQLSRHDLLNWVNTTLKADFTKVDELCTGAAYCQLMHSLYPKMVPIKRVKFCTNLEHEFIDNFRILQTVFQKLQVQKAIPIDRLVRGKFQDNIEFLQWFKKFYDANNEKRHYDPVSVRNGQMMAFGSASSAKKKDKCLTPRGGGAHLQHSYREESSLKKVDRKNTQIFKRSLTRTELRHDLSMSPNFVGQPTSLENEFAKSNDGDLLSSSGDNFQQRTEDIAQEIDVLPAHLTNAGSKLEHILACCLDAKAAGKSSVDIAQVKHIIYNQQLKTENGLENPAQIGAGDHHALMKDMVEES